MTANSDHDWLHSELISADGWQQGLGLLEDASASPPTTTTRFAYEGNAPPAAVAAVSEWDYFFEKRGLPEAWADASSSYVNGKVVKQPMGAMKEAHLDRENAARESDGQEGVLPPEKAQAEAEELDERLRRLTTDELSVPLLVLRALQATDFDRNKALELHILCRRPLTSRGEPAAAAMSRMAEQLALLVPSLPKLHCVLVVGPDPTSSGSRSADDAPSNNTSAAGGGGPTQPRARDHSLNFTGLGGSGTADTAGSEQGNGGASKLAHRTKSQDSKTKSPRSPKAKKIPGTTTTGKILFEVYEGLYDDYVFHAGRQYVLPSLVLAQHMGLATEWVPSVVTLLQK